MHRRPVNKSQSRSAFNGRASKTHRINLSAPLRGGWRL